MRILKCFLISAFFLAGFCNFASAETYGSKQLIPANHWIYDSLYSLYIENGSVFIADNAPLSVEAIRMHLDYIDYDSLSESGKALFDQAQDFLDEKKFIFDWNPVQIGFNLKLHPTVQYKSNDNIDWSFASDFGSRAYTEKTFERDSNGNLVRTGGALNELPAVTKYSDHVANYKNEAATAPLISLPIYLNFADVLFVETEPKIAKNAPGMTKNGNFHNIPASADDFDFLWPTNAYGNTGYIFPNGLSLNFHIAKEGYQQGRSMTGSMIYNDTFQTDANVHFDLTSRRFKYELNLSEVDHTKFLYLHSIDFIPWKWCKLGVAEGCQIEGPFEFRYLNPLMIMHSLGFWTEFVNDWEEKVYGEAHVCAYMGIKVEVVPVKNLRVYFLYSQNEIQPPNELGGNGSRMPDSLGGQLGFELNIPESTGGWYRTGLEAIYTTPMHFLKQGASWSLARTRTDMQSGKDISSWLGSPFGPDALGFQVKFGYIKPGKWNAEFDYLFLAHGTNSFGLLRNTKEIEVTINGIKQVVKVSDYYPSVMYNTRSLTAEEAEEIARSYKLHGTVQFTNRFTIKGEYKLNEHFTFNGDFVYNLVLNNQHIEGQTEQGVELSLGMEYKLF